MKAPKSFIVTPAEDRYAKTKSGLSISTTENAKNVSKRAWVVALPHNYHGPIEVGDEVLVHHNIFREYLDMQGRLQRSRAYLYDELYHAIPEEIFLYHQEGAWHAHLDYCYIEPILVDDISELDKGDLQHTGTIFLSNMHKTGDPIGFTPESEYEIWIDGKLYYRMRDKDVCLYERFE